MRCKIVSISEERCISKKKAVFYGCMLLAIVLSCTALTATDGLSLYDMMVPNYTNHYRDMSSTIYFNWWASPYENGVIYPAGANAFAWLFGRFFPPEIVNAGENTIRDSWIGMFFFMLYNVLTTFIVFWQVYRYKKGTACEKLLFIIVLFLSAPYARQFSKMNTMSISVIFAYIFLECNDSNNKILREISFVCLAISTAIKMYPCIFGLILIKEKRWKEAFRTVLYGIIVFIVPFFWFGGLSNIFTMLESLSRTTGLLTDHGLGFKVSISNLINIYFGAKNIDAEYTSFIANGIAIAVTVLSFITVFFLRNKWEVATVLALIGITYPSFSGSYCILMLIPGLVWFLDDSEESPKSIVYSLLFALCFVPICFGGSNIFPQIEGHHTVGVNVSVLLESISLAAIQVLLIIQGVVNLYRMIQKRQFNL